MSGRGNEEGHVKRVGVTGAAGFVGSHLCDRLLAEGYEVVGVDDLSYGSMGNLARAVEHPAFEFHKLDCTNRHALRAAFEGCDSIAHLAAKKIPRFGGTLSTLEVNVGGVNSACAVALALDADIIVTSTSDVYGNATPPFREDGELTLGPPTTKRWAYAVSKMYDEHVSLALADEKGLKVTILRLFNAYGPQNHLSWWGGPLVTFIEALLDGEPMEIHGDGLQTRSFTYVSDTVDGFVRALRTPESRGEVINIGGTECTSILEVARRVQEQMGIPQPLRATFLPYEALPGNYQDVRERIPDTTKAKELLGFEAQVSFDEGVARTIEWHRELRTRGAVAHG
jgi:UDP-glucose 4-epimerase